MKARTVLLTLALCLVGMPVAYSATRDANMRTATWKLSNEAKCNTSAAGATKNSMVVHEAAAIGKFNRGVAHGSLTNLAVQGRSLRVDGCNSGGSSGSFDYCP